MRIRRFLLLLPALALVLAALTACKGDVSFDCPNTPTTAPTTVVSTTCSLTYTPAPPAPSSTTTTVLPTTTTTVPPTTTTSTPPPPSGFPTPATTGAGANTAFQPVHNGDMTITQAGTYNALHVTGALIVKAAGVTINNSWIEGVGINADEVLVNETAAGSTRMTVTNTTIGNPSVCNGQPGLGEHDYTADHVRIIGMGDGFRVSGNNVTVANSFVQTCNHASNHDDGTQVFCDTTALPQPCHDVRIDHNTLSVANSANFTAPLFGGDTGGINGQLANSSFTNNLLWGGVYSIFLYGEGLTITGNRVATNQWVIPTGQACKDISPGYGVDTPKGCAYSSWVYGASDVTCSTVTWTDNRAVTMDGNWQPTGAGTPLDCA